jgi:hypothetical protein
MIKKSTASALLLSGFLFAGEALLAQDAQNNVAQNPQPGKQNGSSLDQESLDQESLDQESLDQESLDQESLDQEIAMLRSNLRSNRKQVIADNMKLTDSEAEKFWPIYDQYVNELVNINNAKYALIKEYVQNTNMTEEQADSLTKKWLAVDESVVQLRLKYIPIFRRELSAKRTALFFQIDRRVQMLIDLQLASLLPLMQP